MPDWDQEVRFLSKGLRWPTPYLLTKIIPAKIA